MNERRFRRRRWFLVAPAVTALFACAHGQESSFAESEAGAQPAPDASAGGSGAFSAADAGPPPFVECAEETRQIYVVATDKGLYRFYPAESKFIRVGTVGCPTAAGTFSMAIDRFGTAWIEYTDGRVFAVDTRDATCRPTAFQPGHTGFKTFGMGFAKNGDDPKSGETLFISGDGLASLDTTSFELKFLGTLTYGGRTELTAIGTSLYAFSVGSGVIAGLNKTTAATEVVYRTSAIDTWGAFAFAHWGGDFWVFTGKTTSIVTRYSPATDTSTVPIPNTGMLIVGAGSSTCAPTTPPR